MGGSASREEPPPAPAPPSRTMTNTAHEVISERLRHDLRRARADAALYKRHAEEGQADVERALDALEAHRSAAAAAAAAAAALGALAGGALGFLLARRHAAAAHARLAAEAAAIRARGEAALLRAERFGGARLATALLPAVDAVDGLCAAAGGDDEGTRLTRNLLLEALRAHGVERIDAQPGEPFDVDRMEAMLTVPVEGAEGKVEAVLRPGYILHGERILRAAEVGVGVRQAEKEE
ncbi:hypothetical protein AB1Y20_007655 [Prymnesium parvum]|uniref:GrpE protein homolog n=1 Tax=Prymnesium parvum TaxID=97485 RepID=A0AB34IXJ7_PRYPA